MRDKQVLSLHLPWHQGFAPPESPEEMCQVSAPSHPTRGEAVGGERADEESSREACPQRPGAGSLRSGDEMVPSDCCRRVPHPGCQVTTRNPGHFRRCLCWVVTVVHGDSGPDSLKGRPGAHEQFGKVHFGTQAPHCEGTGRRKGDSCPHCRDHRSRASG